ncbi:hypothetical protein GCM10020000_19430 [Streptomyces olivoverticillatus]
MTHGALGALVLADTRRLEQSFEVMGLLEEHGLPYAVAVNHFDGAPPRTRRRRSARPSTCSPKRRWSPATPGTASPPPAR